MMQPVSSVLDRVMSQPLGRTLFSFMSKVLSKRRLNMFHRSNQHLHTHLTPESAGNCAGLGGLVSRPSSCQEVGWVVGGAHYKFPASASALCLLLFLCVSALCAFEESPC